MNFPKKHHWLFGEPHRLLWRMRVEKGGESAEAPKDATKESNIMTSEGRMREWEGLNGKHNPEAYRGSIQKMAEQYSTPNKDSLIDQSVQRYTVTFREIRTRFDGRFHELQQELEADLQLSESKTRERLDALKGELEHVLIAKKQQETKAVKERLGEGNESKTASDKLDKAIEGLDEREVKQAFMSYMLEMHESHVNANWEKGKVRGLSAELPLIAPVLNLNLRSDNGGAPLISAVTNSEVIGNAAYEAYGDKIFSGLKKGVMSRLSVLFQNRKPGTDELQAVKSYIDKNVYGAFAGTDGNPDSISPDDMRNLEAIRLSISNKEIDAKTRQMRFSKLVHQSELGQLNVLYLLDHSVWEDESEQMLEDILEDAKKNGADGQVLKLARDMAELEGKKTPISSFGDAEDYLEGKLERAMQFGVGSTMVMLKKLHEGIGYESEPQFKEATDMGRSYYRMAMNNEVPVMDPQEKVLRELLTTDRDGKSEILKSPQKREELFHAIKAVEEQYAETYEKRYGNRRKTTPESGQLQAYILMAGEARKVVKRFDSNPDHRGVYSRLDKHQVNGKVAMGGFNKRKVRFLATHPPTALAMGGWNLRDMGLLTAQAAGAFTMFLSFASSIQQADGDNFIDRAFNGVEKALGNETVWGAAALTAGATIAKRNPELLNYALANDYEKGQISTNIRLSWLESRMRRVPGRPLKALVEHPSEWEAMKAVVEKGTVEDITKGAKERSKEKLGKKRIPPMLTKSDFEGKIPGTVLSQMNFGDPNMNRARYMLWESMVNSRNPKDVNDLEKWSKSYVRHRAD